MSPEHNDLNATRVRTREKGMKWLKLLYTLGVIWLIGLIPIRLDHFVFKFDKCRGQLADPQQGNAPWRLHRV